MIWRLRLAISRLLLKRPPAGVELYCRRNRVYTRIQRGSIVGCTVIGPEAGYRVGGGAE